MEKLPTVVAQPDQPNADPIPDEYPATKAAMDGMNTVSVETVLNYYNLPVDGDLPAKRARLRQYLGIPPFR